MTAVAQRSNVQARRQNSSRSKMKYLIIIWEKNCNNYLRAYILNWVIFPVAFIYIYFYYQISDMILVSLLS